MYFPYPNRIRPIQGDWQVESRSPRLASNRGQVVFNTQRSHRADTGCVQRGAIPLPLQSRLAGVHGR